MTDILDTCTCHPSRHIACATADLNEFIDAYIACALWLSTDEEGEPVDATYDARDVAPEARRTMEEDCTAFYTENRDECWAHGTDEQCGYDFWITRNHHGTGFWDRGTGTVGDRLTTAAHTYGECYVYVGDDGRLYVA